MSMKQIKGSSVVLACCGLVLAFAIAKPIPVSAAFFTDDGILYCSDSNTDLTMRKLNELKVDYPNNEKLNEAIRALGAAKTPEERMRAARKIVGKAATKGQTITNVSINLGISYADANKFVNSLKDAVDRE